jgi:hypothetical protein
MSETEHEPIEPSTPAARALAEAEARRREQAAEEKTLPKELGNRKGPEPTRYGDWEKGGITSDF